MSVISIWSKCSTYQVRSEVTKIINIIAINIYANYIYICFTMHHSRFDHCIVHTVYRLFRSFRSYRSYTLIHNVNYFCDITRDLVYGALTPFGTFLLLHKPSSPNTPPQPCPFPNQILDTET